MTEPAAQPAAVADSLGCSQVAAGVRAVQGDHEILLGVMRERGAQDGPAVGLERLQELVQGDLADDDQDGRHPRLDQGLDLLLEGVLDGQVGGRADAPSGQPAREAQPSARDRPQREQEDQSDDDEIAHHVLLACSAGASAARPLARLPVPGAPHTVRPCSRGACPSRTAGWPGRDDAPGRPPRRWWREVEVRRGGTFKGRISGSRWSHAHRDQCADVRARSGGASPAHSLRRGRVRPGGRCPADSRRPGQW